MERTGPMVKVKPRFSAPLKNLLKESGGERQAEREDQTAAGPSSKKTFGNKKGMKRPVKEEGDNDGRKDSVKKRREEEEEVDHQKQSINGNKKGKKRPAKEEGDDNSTKDYMKKRREEEEVDDQEAAKDISTEPDDISPREEENEMPQSRGEQEDEGEEDVKEDSSDARWVQCCKPECGKWRKLVPQTDPSELPWNWNCTMNIDPAYNSCSVSEEENDESEDYVIMSNLVAGSLVWAQQRGYPWWPALIENDPCTHTFYQFKTETDTQPSRYHVTYLGDPVSRAWVPKSKVKPYMDLTEHYVQKSASKGYRQKLKGAIAMALKAQKIPLVERLDEFGFLRRQAEQDGESDFSLSTCDSELQEAMEDLVEKIKKSQYKKKRSNEDKAKQKNGKRASKKRAVLNKQKRMSGGLTKKDKRVAKQAPYESLVDQEERDMEGTDPDQDGGKETDYSSDSW